MGVCVILILRLFPYLAKLIGPIFRYSNKGQQLHTILVYFSTLWHLTVLRFTWCMWWTFCVIEGAWGMMVDDWPYNELNFYDCCSTKSWRNYILFLTSLCHNQKKQNLNWNLLTLSCLLTGELQKNKSINYLYFSFKNVGHVCSDFPLCSC